MKVKSLLSALYKSFKVIIIFSEIAAVIFIIINFATFSQIIDRYVFTENFLQRQKALYKLTNQQNKISIIPSLQTKEKVWKNFPPLSSSMTPLENYIVIPKIAKNVPIVEISDQSLLNADWKGLENDIQRGLQYGVVHYPQTALPGKIGNFFLTGHSSYYSWNQGEFKDAFVLLHDIDLKDQITVFYGQKRFDYQVKEIKITKPKDVSILDQPENKKIITLMTCTPIGTAKNRLVIIAEEV